MHLRALLPMTLLVATAFGGCGEKEHATTNPSPMPPDTYELAVRALKSFAAGMDEPRGSAGWSDNDNGRLVSAVHTDAGPIVITSAASSREQGRDVCLQARVYGEPGVAFLDTSGTKATPRTETPGAAGCQWFLRNPDAVPSTTEIVDFGAGDVVFAKDTGTSRPWPRELVAVREQMVDLVSESLQPWLDEHGDGEGYRIPEPMKRSRLASYSVTFEDGQACLKATLPGGRSLWYVTEGDEFLRTAEEAAGRPAC